MLGPLLGPLLCLGAASLPVKDMVGFIVSALLFSPIYVASPAMLKRKVVEGSVMFWVFLFVSGAPLLYGAFIFGLLRGPFWLRALLAAYGVHIYLDRRPHLPATGAGAHPVRSWTVLKLYREYFPCSLRKSCRLDPQRKYVFGYHPHGILSLGCLGNVASDVFGTVFPGINVHPLTLKSNFVVPFSRELALGLGFRDSGRRTCDAILQHGGPGAAICLVVGGAAEAIETDPGGIDLTLAHRKGFVRVALANGADLVPCITFGENETFEVVTSAPGSLMHDISAGMKAAFGFSIPIFYGHSTFLPPALRWLTFGLLPLPRKITTVVGEPVKVKQFKGDLRSGKGAELVNKVHRKYLKALRKLYDGHKEVHFLSRQRTIRFLDTGRDFPKFEESARPGGAMMSPRQSVRPGLEEVEELLEELRSPSRES